MADVEDIEVERIVDSIDKVRHETADKLKFSAQQVASIIGDAPKVRRRELLEDFVKAVQKCLDDPTEPCHQCSGSGRIQVGRIAPSHKRCDYCGGSGRLKKDE